MDNLATAPAAPPTSMMAAEVIDIQVLIKQREELIRQRDEAERALKNAAKHEQAIVEQLRQQARDLYMSLGLTPERVWYDLTRAASVQTPAADSQAKSTPATRSKPGDVAPTHKWTNAQGGTFYFNATSKGKRPAWLTAYKAEVIDTNNKVRIDVMQPYDDVADRSQWLTSLVREKKPVGGN
jgi:hypothetical protein